ncbi:hypothetical protein E2I00_011876, partial [Balaenoptera physalus]
TSVEMLTMDESFDIYMQTVFPYSLSAFTFTNMKHRNYSTAYSYSYCIYRLYTTMRTNVILRGSSHYKPALSNLIHWHHSCRMDLRRLFLLVAVHLLFLHETGSNNPTGIPSDTDKIPLHPYYTIKDILGALLLILASLILVLFSPDLLGDPDNYTPANPLNTPPHITPE